MKNLAAAVIAVMKSVKGMEKNSKVGRGSNSYDGTKDSDVKEVFNEALASNGLIVLPISIEPKVTVDRWEEVDPYSKSTPKDLKTKQSVFTEVKTKYLLVHESGESVELAGYGQGVDPQDKGAGKATTYALKNCLLNTFVTPVGKMDDTDKEHSLDKPVPQKKRKPQKSAPKPRKLNEGEITKVIEWALRKNASIDRVKDFYILTEAEEKKFKNDTKAVKEETIALKGVET